MTIDAGCSLHMLKFPMDSHSCPLSFSSCEYLLRFLGPQSHHAGPLLFLILSFYIFLPLLFPLRWCQSCPGPPNPSSSPFRLTILCFLTWASRWVHPSPVHPTSNQSPASEVYLKYVCFPSPLSLLPWFRSLSYSTWTLQHLHFEAEHVQN